MELPSTNKIVTKGTDKKEEAKDNKIIDDPLSITADPLSGSLASDPLTAALIDPLASAQNPPSGVAKVTMSL